MADPRVVKGAAVPLFERLIDFDPASSVEAKVFRHLSEAELLGSVRREIERIFSTKRPLGVKEALAQDNLTVLDYGIPDSSGLSPHDLPGCNLLALALERAIAAFEPRLLNPKVRITRHPDVPTAMQVVVGGSICPGDYVEDVWFPIHMNPSASAFPGPERRASPGAQR